MSPEIFLHNSSEALGLLCLAGVLAGLVRWPVAARRDLLLAFIVFLAGAFLREIVVYIYGATGWGPDALLLSFAARLIQVAGAVLFVRAALLQSCGEWGWIATLATATALMVIL